MVYIWRLSVSLFFVFLANSIYSQSISNQVVASSGIEFVSDSASINWTLGENFTETLIVEKGVQTLGFHQTQIEVEEDQFLAPEVNIEIYPNPFVSDVYLKSQDKLGEINVQVYSIIGEKIYQKKINMDHICRLDLSFLLNGVYLVKINYPVAEQYLIIKQSN